MRVLLAVDGSPSSESARRVVDAMAWPAGTIIRVVGVVPPISPRVAAFGVPLPEPSESEQESVLRATVHATTASLQRPGRRVERIVKTGRPASVIVDEAAVFGAELIVVGSRGLGRLGSMAAGLGLRGGRRSRPVPGPRHAVGRDPVRAGRRRWVHLRAAGNRAPRARLPARPAGRGHLGRAGAPGRRPGRRDRRPGRRRAGGTTGTGSGGPRAGRRRPRGDRGRRGPGSRPDRRRAAAGSPAWRGSASAASPGTSCSTRTPPSSWCADPIRERQADPVVEGEPVAAAAGR